MFLNPSMTNTPKLNFSDKDQSIFATTFGSKYHMFLSC